MGIKWYRVLWTIKDDSLFIVTTMIFVSLCVLCYFWTQCFVFWKHLRSWEGMVVLGLNWEAVALESLCSWENNHGMVCEQGNGFYWWQHFGLHQIQHLVCKRAKVFDVIDGSWSCPFNGGRLYCKQKLYGGMKERKFSMLQSFKGHFKY